MVVRTVVDQVNTMSFSVVELALTWSFRIVGVELGSNSHGYGHLNEKYNCVKKGLEEDK